MKNLFAEPEIEILSFLCDTAPGVDSETLPGGDESADGGDIGGILP